MGQTITAMCKDDPEIEIVAGIDLYDGIKNDYPVFPNISVCDVKADAVIDFSNAKAVDDLLIYCEENRCRLYCARPVCLRNSSQE